MTPERLADLKSRWSGGAYEELFAEIDRLLTALRETQERHAETRGLVRDLTTTLEGRNRERDALQRRVEKLEETYIAFWLRVYSSWKALDWKTMKETLDNEGLK